MISPLGMDILIGLLFTYMLLSVMCSAVNEWVGAITMSRSRNLVLGIKSLLNDPKGAFVFNVPELDSTGKEVLVQKNLFNELAKHPLVRGLTRTGPLNAVFNQLKLPPYIASGDFATALLDVLAPSHSAAQPRSLGEILNAIDALPAGETRRVLQVIAQSSGPKLETLKHNIGLWFDGGMERVSGCYKRRTQVMVLVIAGLVATVLNADTFMMLRILATDPVQRARLVASTELALQAQPAQGVAAGAPTPTAKDLAAAKQAMDEANKALSAQSLPILWAPNAPPDSPRKIPRTSDEWWTKIGGLLISTIAISMGAPFYFDLLKRHVNTRLTGVPPDEMPARPPARA